MNFSLIENKIEISNLDKYAAIIGEAPSKGARSPKLWNAVFKSNNLNYSMVPFDVTKDNIIDLLSILSQDIDFIGGAIAVPYKEIVAKWLGNNLTPEAKKIGAVNCLYRDFDGKLKGTNTDGEAALMSYKSIFGSVKGKTVMILGTGGAAKAIAAYFSNNVGLDGGVKIVGRLERGREFSKSINASSVEWSELDDNLSDIDIVINCTTIGYGDQEELSPLTSEQMHKLKNNTVIFDII